MKQLHQVNYPEQLSDVGPAAETILDSLADGVFTVDLDGRITSFNQSAETITGTARAAALGRPCAEVFRSSLCGQNCPMQRSLREGRSLFDKTGVIGRVGGERTFSTISSAVLRDEQGRIVGAVESFRSQGAALPSPVKSSFKIGEMLSCSPTMRHLAELVPVVAASLSTVLIQGETGTGKELLARALHALSSRSDKPFVAVNCAALPDNLLESELFGYKKGAFTGASRDKPGRFALAHQGTLFLDEIGEISPALQAKLLRVLQEHVYEPLGALRPESSDARIILATNRNLDELVRQGSFRRDLFYRINVIALELPPLRRRLEDLALLCEHFLEQWARRNDEPVKRLAPEAQAILNAYDWPGNVRELENVIERACVLCTERLIEPEHLSAELLETGSCEIQSGSIAAIRQLTERQYILNALIRNSFNKAATARELGIHQTTLFRKIKAFGIVDPAKRSALQD